MASEACRVWCLALGFYFQKEVFAGGTHALRLAGLSSAHGVRCKATTRLPQPRRGAHGAGFRAALRPASTPAAGTALPSPSVPDGGRGRGEPSQSGAVWKEMAAPRGTGALRREQCGRVCGVSGQHFVEAQHLAEGPPSWGRRGHCARQSPAPRTEAGDVPRLCPQPLPLAGSQGGLCTGVGPWGHGAGTTPQSQATGSEPAGPHAGTRPRASAS